MIHYTITTHPHVIGAYLSRSGVFGNVPHGGVEEARRAAHRDAKGAAYAVRVESAAARKG